MTSLKDHLGMYLFYIVLLPRGNSYPDFCKKHIITYMPICYGLWLSFSVLTLCIKEQMMLLVFSFITSCHQCFSKNHSYVLAHSSTGQKCTLICLNFLFRTLWGWHSASCIFFLFVNRFSLYSPRLALVSIFCLTSPNAVHSLPYLA